MLKKVIFSAAHLIFWGVFIALSTEMSFRISEGLDFFLRFAGVYMWNLTWAMTAVYVFYFWIAKILLIRRKPFTYLFTALVISPLISSGYFFIIYFFHPEVREMMNVKLYFVSMMTTFILGQIGTLLAAFTHWYNEVERKADLEKIQLHNELSVLRSQLNPHFLFNTLNNIDSLIRTDSKQASKAIIKLSEMMRYMLYETSQEFLSLGQEKQYLDDFISLQRLRHSSPDSIEYSSELNDEQLHILPLLFLPFIENAFKFASRKANQPLVSIYLKEDAGLISFSCSNYFNPDEKENDVPGGLGINNVKQRLEAYYAGRYTLSIRKKTDLYQVELKISLHD